MLLPVEDLQGSDEELLKSYIKSHKKANKTDIIDPDEPLETEAPNSNKPVYPIIISDKIEIVPKKQSDKVVVTNEKLSSGIKAFYQWLGWLIDWEGKKIKSVEYAA